MIIKAANKPDLAAIRDLLHRSELHFDDVDGKPGQQFMLAWEGENLIGTVALELAGEFALLRSLAVAPEHRRRGIATKLVNEIEIAARSMRIRDLYLLTLTAADFFAELGYQQTDRAKAPAGLQETTEFKSVCPASAICMKKKLAL